jgi:hypothetical protein
MVVLDRNRFQTMSFAAMPPGDESIETQPLTSAQKAFMPGNEEHEMQQEA